MIIAIDFDGTIVEHKYPEIGEEIPNAFKVLNVLKEEGHTLILWTFRSGKLLAKAVHYCKQNGLEFYAINSNSPEEAYVPQLSRKIYADLYIDDRNILGIPDWGTMYNMISPDNQ